MDGVSFWGLRGARLGGILTFLDLDGLLQEGGRDVAHRGLPGGLVRDPQVRGLRGRVAALGDGLHAGHGLVDGD